jgi:zinc D-Ala-D-Ala carboxypeptidase
MPTAHFNFLELRCKCGCGKLPPQDFQDKIEALREKFGAPLVISSGARCAVHNQAVSTTGPGGPHTVAAVDFRIHGPEAFRLLKLALEMGFTGIGVRQKGPREGRFIHVDDRRRHPGPAVWSY